MFQKTAIKKKDEKEISKQITHFINTYCRESSVSFYDAYEKLSKLYKSDEAEFNTIMNNQKCPPKVS